VAKENERRSQAEVVRKLLKKVEEKLGGADVKVTLADYIRLVQLKKELEEDEPREIRVTWIERDSESSTES
jgi:Arc/MetJ-type ribon-helix-helix transcriptional regulator